MCDFEHTWKYFVEGELEIAWLAFAWSQNRNSGFGWLIILCNISVQYTLKIDPWSGQYSCKMSSISVMFLSIYGFSQHCICWTCQCCWCGSCSFCSNVVIFPNSIFMITVMGYFIWYRRTVEKMLSSVMPELMHLQTCNLINSHDLGADDVFLLLA